MGNWKTKKEILRKFNGYKKIFTLVEIFFQVHLRNSQKE